MAEKKELSPNLTLLITLGVFGLFYFAPIGSPRVSGAIVEGFAMLQDYAREHVLLCLIPAMFIAGAITVFLNQRSVIRFLGPKAPKPLAYGVAAVSGAILAVCSCTVLPLFKGIYKKGAGLGPAIAFLYSGPAINILAIILSYKIFGWELGAARMIGAVIFSILIGLSMQFIFRKEDAERLANERMFAYNREKEPRTLGQMAAYMGTMIAILIVLNWPSSQGASAFWDRVHEYRFLFSGVLLAILAIEIVRWFSKDEVGIWLIATRDFALQIVPYLFAGVLVAGFLLGRPGHEALIPTDWVAGVVGGNSLGANFGAAVAGAFMYFATLTEVPIVQGLLGAGMGKGPALALLLAGPSLSLPSMIVIGRELGWKKTSVYVILVVGFSTLAGWAFGSFS